MTKSVTDQEQTIRLEDYPSFGYWLRRRRKALDLTQAELARHAGCSAAMIRKMEADERRPSLQLAELLAQELQIPEEQVEAFTRFARGIEAESATGLESLAPPAVARLADRATTESAPAVAHNLPPQTTPFFGRAAELRALGQYLAESKKRLVTVLGPGGMGKTRLALAAAQAQLSSPTGERRFADGVFFVPLAGTAAAGGQAADADLAAAVAEALDFQFSGADETQAQLLRYLSARRLLLVLDNFEHLLPGVQLLQEILNACPTVTLLVTSREKLKLAAEQLFPIGGLNYPAAGETVDPGKATGYSALQLFLERAQSIRPSFELNAGNLEAVAGICHQVAGMPLGIVLAAAWIDTLTAGEIAREIGRDPDFLEAEMAGMPARQRSLRAAFNYSWRLLSPAEQAIYGQLSVFRGGFSAEAARQVTGATLRDLQALVSKSLLARAAAPSQTTAARYNFHELLRQFAAAELARQPDLQSAARQAHSACYLQLLQEHESRWHTAEQQATLLTVARESDNIAAAWRLALEAGAWEQLAGAIDSWCQYHHWQGLFSAGYTLCSELEARLKVIEDPPTASSGARTVLWARVLVWQAIFLSGTEEALAKIEECLAYLERSGLAGWQSQSLKASALRQMAWRLIPVAVEEAHDCAQQALALSLPLDDRWQAARSHYYLGLIELKLGSLASARQNTESALAIFGELGDRRMLMTTAIILAWITEAEGDLVAAERLRLETLDLCQQIGDRPTLVYCWGDLASTQIARGKLNEGLHSAKQAVVLSVEFGFRDKEGWAHSVLSYALLHLGKYERSRQEVDRGLDLVRETGNRDVETGLWSTQGYLALVRGDEGRQAHAFFERALQLNETIQEILSFGDHWNGLLLAACQMGVEDQARTYAISFLDYVIDFRHYHYLFRSLAAVAYYLARFGDRQQASDLWQLASSQPFIANSQWYADVVGREIDARTAGLSPPAAASPTPADLWQTAESLLAALS